VRREGLVEAVRRQLRRLPDPYAAHYGIVPPPPPEGVLALGDALPKLRAASEALVKVNTLAAELKDPYILSRILTRQEAVSSSAIEGTNSTLDELLNAEETDDASTSDAVAQVRDYATTLETLLPRARALGHGIFDVALIGDLHSAVMRGDSHYQDKPGALRNAVVWIGGGRDISHSTYNPTPPDNIADSLSQTIAYMRCSGLQEMHQNLITRMAVAHVHFEAVHPFRDGNGRVGRLLLPLMMAAEGHTPLYLSPYIDANKPAYYEALKAAQQRLDWQHAVGFIAGAIVGTVDELMVTRDALSNLANAWKQKSQSRRNSSAALALEMLPHYPVITVKRLADLLSVSIPAAARAAKQLTDSGILTEQTGYHRNRVFVALEVLSILNRPFGADPRIGDEPEPIDH
jgi:Fic family protein